MARVDDSVVGVAAWEAADADDTPNGCRGLLLHGLYVHPDYQHRGIGSALLQQAMEAADSTEYDGLLVKAQAQAADYFAAQGFDRLTVSEQRRDYTYRFWKPNSDSGQ